MSRSVCIFIYIVDGVTLTHVHYIKYATNVRPKCLLVGSMKVIMAQNPSRQDRDRGPLLRSAANLNINIVATRYLVLNLEFAAEVMMARRMRRCCSAS